MSSIEDTGRSVNGVALWVRILILWLAFSGIAAAACSYSSVSGSGFYYWNSNTYDVLPSGGTGSLTINFTSTGCTWSVSIESPAIATSATSGTASSTTSVTIQFSVPAYTGAAPIGPLITVFVNGSQVVSAGQGIFQNSSNCAITSFSPASASFGASGGSDSVTLNISPSGCWYFFDYPASYVTVQSFTDGYTIPYTVAANTGTQRTTSISFTEPSSASFTITQAGIAPIITSLSPSSAMAGGPAFMLLVNGSGFSGSTNVIYWNGQALTTGFNSENSGQLFATVPANLIATAGTATVTVVSGGVASNGVAFTIVGSLSVNPTTVSLNATGGTTTPVTAVVNVTSSAAFTATVQPGASWLSVSPTSGAASAALTISANPSNLPAGTYNGTITVATVTSSVSVSVIFTVAPGVSVPPSLLTSGLTFTASQSGQSNSSTFTITSASGSIPFTITYTTQSGGNWLSGPPSGVATPAGTSITVTTNSGSLPPNQTYIGTITVTGGGISVSFNVFLTPQGTQIVASPTQITISVPAGQKSSLQYITLSQSGFAATLMPANTYLLLYSSSSSNCNNASAYTANGNLNLPTAICVGVDATSLSAGAQSSSIVVQCVSTSCFNATIAVTVTVTTAPALQLSASTLTFPVSSGTVSQAQSVNLTATGGAQLAWAATAPSWIKLGTSSGTASSTATPISITVDATSLQPGSTTGNVIFGCVNSSTCAQINLQVTAIVTSSASISSLTPSSVVAGSAGFSLAVNGTGFVSGAVVDWGSTVLSTTFVSATQLTAVVPASLIANAGTVNVTVTNPGGQASAASTFTITAAAALTITSINPSSATTGGPSLTVTITGSGFVSGDIVQLNGLSLSTNFVSATTLTAQIPASDLLNPGTGQIAVENPSGPASSSVPFFVSSTSALQFMPVPTCRVMDTRPGSDPTDFPPGSTFGPPTIAAGTVRPIPIPLSVHCPGVPANAAAYSLNFTVQPRTTTVGSLTVWPTGTAQPNVSTLSFSNPAVPLAAAGIVPAGASGSINATFTQDADLIIDINGYFVPPTAGTLQFYSLPPCRVLDTRTPENSGSFPDNSPFGSPALGANQARSFTIPASPGNCGAPANASAYSFNVGAVPQGALYFLAAYPPGGYQGISTLNSFDGIVLANAAIVPAADGGMVSFLASNLTDFFVDINGYFAPPGNGGLNFYTVPPCRLVDTRSGNGGTFNADETRTFPLRGSCGIPVGTAAQAYSLGITVYPVGGGLYYLTTWPTGDPRPNASTLNAITPLLPIANAALVPAGTGGSINVFVTNPTDVTIDIAGYFGP